MHVVEQEEQLTVVHAGNHGQWRAVGQGGVEAGVENLLGLVGAQPADLGLPALAVGRVGEHEVEVPAAVPVVGKRGAVGDVVGLGAVALQEQVGLGDGAGLRVDFLPEEQYGDLLAALSRQCQEALLGDGEHSAGAAGAVVAKVAAVADLAGHGDEHQVGHELDDVAGCPVLAGLLVVLVVEPAEKLLEHHAHVVVVQPRQFAGGLRAEVDGGRGEPLNHRAQNARVHEGLHLVAELELGDDVRHVGREAVQVGEEIRLERGGVPAAGEVAQQPGEALQNGCPACLQSASHWLVMPRAVSHALRSRTACLVSSSMASRRRMTVMGNMTSRYLPRW